MGVTGLWRLIEPSGKPVPLETLENRVLAVDVSIWLHQAIKGFQDAQGAPLPNAHLLGIYHRVCKLLYFRVKPVFVFDGGVPNLKKETISKRNQLKSKKLSEAERIQKQLLTTLLKHSAVNKVLSEKAKASLATKTNSSKASNKDKSEDIYKLPPTDFDSTRSSSEDESTSESVDSSPTKHWDLHTIDEKSPHFKALPADVRHDILTELKETRKQSSWGKIHEMPKQSGDFSSFQMKRLLKRYSVQISLEEAEREMGGRSLSLAELETLLKDQGVVTSSSSVGSRIASDENTRYLLIKDVKKAMDEAKKQKELSNVLQVKVAEKEDEEQKQSGDDETECVDKEKISIESETKNGNKEPVESQVSAIQTDNIPATTHNSDSEFQRDLEKAIQLSLQDVPSTSKENNSERKSTSSKHNFSFLEDFDDADFQSSSESEEDSHHQKHKNRLASVKSYMTEYSGLTPSEIAKIIGSNSGLPNKNKTYENASSARKIEAVSTDSSNMLTKTIGISSEESENSKSKPVLNEILLEENDDRTVSSSTTTISKFQNVVTNNSVDSNEVSSSTNSGDISHNPEAIDKYNNDTETVEVMSDGDASSDASDFLEVSEKQNTSGKRAGGFEILIKPEDSLEDDIFSDIFSGKKEESCITIKELVNNASNTEKNNLIQTVKPVVTVDGDSKSVEIITKRRISNKELEIFNSESSSTNKKVKLNENLIDSNQLTKEERTKNLVAEFITPLQQTGELRISDTDKSSMQSPEENQILTTEQLERIEENLRQEKEELIAGRLSKERMASNLTEQIYQEAQELLQLFGVPFIVAPMEAEAQCAFLDDINLTDGTITDDSDIWLFGGKTVYKNFFNQHKHVMEFRAENIHHHFKLTREQMVLLALLVGSDYTVGLQGIGPVTALEILAAFPPPKLTEIQLTHQQLLSGLEEFRRWLKGERAVGPGRTTLRNKLKNVTLTESFPSLQVVKAYLEPAIDSSKEPFSWAKPDIVGLIEFARQKFGWTRVKSEEILKPVLKRLNETRIQRSIKDYFRTKHKIDSGEAESKMSKRVKKAVNRIGKEKEDNSDEEKSKPKTSTKKIQRRKRVTKSAKEGNIETQEADKRSENVAEFAAGLSSDEDIQILKKTRTQSKKKLEQIQSDVKKEFEQQMVQKPRTIASLHKQDVIPQKEMDKIEALRSKMKAIEVFRKSKKGPGYVKKRKVVSRKPKEDAELSESSSS